MSKLPCKKCKACGVYHDLSVTLCDKCGADLTRIPSLLVEADEIPRESRGVINESVTVLVQKCSACGAENFITDKDAPVRVCYNCHKTRVATIQPIPYVSAEKEEETDAIVMTDEGDKEDSAQWQDMLGNIRQSIGTEPAEDEDDEDDDVADWGDILGGEDKAQPSITLSAVCYGQLSFSVEAGDDVQYMLGRSANQSEFLSKDGRVSNQHCCLYCKEGAWYVRDNHSSNGTAVNGRDIGLNGEQKLNDGDELKLGHHPDSMAFRVSIK